MDWWMKRWLWVDVIAMWVVLLMGVVLLVRGTVFILGIGG